MPLGGMWGVGAHASRRHVGGRTHVALIFVKTRVCAPYVSFAWVILIWMRKMKPTQGERPF